MIKSMVTSRFKLAKINYQKICIVKNFDDIKNFAQLDVIKNFEQYILMKSSLKKKTIKADNQRNQ